MTSAALPSSSELDRPRTIVTADPELDDLNSMIRLLLYSNELEIEGLVYASSRYHWKGDGRGTLFFLPDREYPDPRATWRWAPNERFIGEAIDAYAEVHENLRVHDPRYPTPDTLRGLVREGNVAFEGDMSGETPGSRLIEEALLDDRPGPLHLQTWAGTSTIARALRSIEERFHHTPEWAELSAAISAKAIITKFDSQDATYEEYIRPTWPDIRVTDVATWAWGYNARRLALPEDAHLLGADWMRANVTAVGPLGALYRTWGDGRRMVEDDPTDYFHLSGLTTDELTGHGYQVWTDPQDAGGWISEGDSTNMLNLFGNGLRAHEHPSYGGWGGRSVRTESDSNEWSVAAAHDSSEHADNAHEYAVTRWFADAQRDFAARLRWTVSPTFGQVNHHPVVHLTSGTAMTGVPGETLALRAVLTDPDGDSLSCRWWHYPEAGAYPHLIPIRDAETAAAWIRIPEDGVAGQTIHVILEVQDDGEYPLKAYQRVVITIDSAEPTTIDTRDAEDGR